MLSLVSKTKMKKTELIIRDSKILGGKPIIAGTRMSVEVILEFLAGGMEIKEMLKEFSFLNKKQIESAQNVITRTPDLVRGT